MRLKQIVSTAVLAAIVAAPLLSGDAFAATGLIYLTPGSSSLQQGSSETVSLRINPGTTVDGVQATVSYNAADLQLNSVDTSSSPFTTQLQKSAGGGTITLALGNLSGGVSSDALIAYINFTALAGSGSATLAISNANATYSGSYTNPSTANASIGFTAPPVATPPPSSPESGSSGSSTYSSPRYSTSSSSSTAAQPATTALVAAPATPLAPAKLTAAAPEAGFTVVTLHITSDRAVDLYAMYGTDSKHLVTKTGVASSATKAALVLGDGAPLTPGTEYYYQVYGVDAGGVTATLPVQHVITKGYRVAVTVLDSHNKPLAGQKVSLHSRLQSATTDSHGIAVFTDVAPGEHHLEYTAAGKTYTEVVYVENTVAGSKAAKNVPVQTAAVILPVQLAAARSSVSLKLAAGVLLVAIVAVGLLRIKISPFKLGWQQLLKPVAAHYDPSEQKNASDGGSESGTRKT